MAAKTEIDTTATADGLASEAASRAEAIAAGEVTLPVGNYVAATNALGAGLVAGRLAIVGTRVAGGARAAVDSVASYEATEGANATALTT
ncbi:hypothetical protein [Mycolicibacterium tusciae]|uniref:hypothetical protein n=1 Tax=Mycolicibacterium tusciae TaxID=75922 RepID=UPI00024A1F38|nr:hypothetical protein [Mycolicibacterium tusciae]